MDILEALEANDDRGERRLRLLVEALELPDGTAAFYAFGAPRNGGADDEPPRPARVFCAPEAAGWWSDYCADRVRHARDPVRTAIRSGIAPVYWNAFVPRSDFARSTDPLWEHLRDHRIAAGLSVPLHDPSSGRYGSFSVIQFGTREALAGWMTSHLSRLCAAAFAFHLSVGRDESRVPPVRLSRREAECLAMVADGLTSKQIARRLALSPKTIDLHIARACWRLGVATRAQAVARGIESGSLRRPSILDGGRQ